MNDLEIIKDAFNKIARGNFGYVEIKYDKSKDASIYLIIAYKSDHDEILSYKYYENLPWKWQNKGHWSFDQEGCFESC